MNVESLGPIALISALSLSLIVIPSWPVALGLVALCAYHAVQKAVETRKQDELRALEDQIKHLANRIDGLSMTRAMR